MTVCGIRPVTSGEMLDETLLLKDFSESFSQSLVQNPVIKVIKNRSFHAALLGYDDIAGATVSGVTLRIRIQTTAMSK